MAPWLGELLWGGQHVNSEEGKEGSSPLGGSGARGGRAILLLIFFSVFAGLGARCGYSCSKCGKAGNSSPKLMAEEQREVSGNQRGPERLRAKGNVASLLQRWGAELNKG